MKEQPSVLLVDDSRDMLELLRRYMNNMGLTPFTTNNVVDAIAVLEQGPVDLVITDLNMPDVHGTQLVRYVAQHFPKVPILVLTGYPEVQVAVDVMKLGAVEFLVKPVTQDELRVAVEKALGNATLIHQYPLGNDRNSGNYWPLTDHAGCVPGDRTYTEQPSNSAGNRRKWHGQRNCCTCDPLQQ